MNTHTGVGAMRERIHVERKGWPVLSVTLADDMAGALLTTVVPHNWQSGDYVQVAGDTSSPSVNGVHQVTVTGPTTATFPLESGVGSPAPTGLTATFLKDAQGSVRDSWVSVALMPAAVVPLSAQERLAQPPALMTTRFTRFQVRNIAGLNEQQRVRWTPTHPPESPEQILQITGVVQPPSDDRRFLMLECVGP